MENIPCNHHLITLSNRPNHLKTCVDFIPKIWPVIFRVDCALQSTKKQVISTASMTKKINTNQNCNFSTKWNSYSTFCILDEFCCKIIDLGFLGNSVSDLETVKVKSYPSQRYHKRSYCFLNCRASLS
jgi:hypothetical protein